MTRTYVLPGIAVIALSLFTYAATNAFAQGIPDGSYSGAMSDGNRQVRVDAQFANQSVSLHFGEPYRCRLSAIQSGTTSEGILYIFGPAPNGGAFCERLENMALTVKMSASSAIVSFVQRGVQWSGNLDK